MKPLIPAATAALLLWTATPAPAQDRKPLVRGDAAATAGWLAVNKTEFDSYNDWHGQGLFTIGAGWYWTDHLKTEVEFGATTETRTYGSADVFIGGQRYIAPAIIEFSSNRVALIQRYQFFRNEWFHPSIGAGVDIVSEKYSSREESVYFYDQVTKQSRVLRDAVERDDENETEVRAVVAGGFKAYLTQRTFFLGDMRVTFASRAEDTLLRFGFGVDF